MSLISWAWGRETDGLSVRSSQEEIDAGYKKLEAAQTYSEWLAAANLLDGLEGGLAWKRDPSSPHYDSIRIQKRLNEMYKLEAEGDVENMLFWLRSGMSRNLGGIGNNNLYNQTHVGTKRLIEEHQDELCRMLHMACDSESVPLERRLSFFTESRHALGKTALLLSGGASLGMYHFGVITALFNQNLLPRVMSGSSAGAIVLAIIGVRTNEQLAELCGGGTEAIERSLRLDFFDPKRSLRRKLWRILTKGVLMDVQVLQDALRHNIGDVTFQEAYERTGRIINITISPGNSWEKPRLLNYLTAPNVLVWSAASASCALPLLFEGVELVAKNARGDHVPYNLTNVKWTDGSLHSDLPVNQLKELFNVNYLIVSQVNPHAIPFVQNAHRGVLPKMAARERRNGVVSRVVSGLGSLARSELLHRCRQASDVGVMPSFLAALINQQYVGDVTLVAPLCVGAYLNIISNPTSASLARFLETAERRAWPSIAHIHSACRVEITLDDCVRKLASQAQALMNARLPPAMPRSKVQQGVLDDLASPISFAPRANRHTHIDLQSYFGTSTVRSNSSQNLAVFQSFASERDLDPAVSDAGYSDETAAPRPSLESAEASVAEDEKKQAEEEEDEKEEKEEKAEVEKQTGCAELASCTPLQLSPKPSPALHGRKLSRRRCGPNGADKLDMRAPLSDVTAFFSAAETASAHSEEEAGSAQQSDGSSGDGAAGGRGAGGAGSREGRLRRSKRRYATDRQRSLGISPARSIPGRDDGDDSEPKMKRFVV